MDDMDTGSAAGSPSSSETMNVVNPLGGAGDHLLDMAADHSQQQQPHQSMWTSSSPPSTSSSAVAIAASEGFSSEAGGERQRRIPSEKFLREKGACLDYFNSWSEQDQIDFVEDLLQVNSKCIVVRCSSDYARVCASV